MKITTASVVSCDSFIPKDSTNPIYHYTAMTPDKCAVYGCRFVEFYSGKALKEKSAVQLIRLDKKWKLLDA